MSCAYTQALLCPSMDCCQHVRLLLPAAAPAIHRFMTSFTDARDSGGCQDALKAEQCGCMLQHCLQAVRPRMHACPLRSVVSGDRPPLPAC